MATIEAAWIRPLLEFDGFVDVYRFNGGPVFVAGYFEIGRLLSRNMIHCAVIGKNNRIKRLILGEKVHASSAKRLAHRVSLSEGACITKKKQGNGAANWVTHFDKAEGGFLGGSSSFHSGLFSRGINSKLCVCKRCRPDLHKQAQEHAA